MSDMSDVTQILGKIEAGDPAATDKLLPLVYDELRKLAAEKMAQEKPDQTLQATALVHEAYIRLVDVEKAQHWDNCRHFLAAASEAMRRILVERARRKQGPESEGSRQRVALSDVDPEKKAPRFDLLDLNEALDKLEAEDARAAALVRLRFFTGLTRQQAAASLGVSIATVDNDWAYAKSWLRLELFRSAEVE